MSLSNNLLKNCEFLTVGKFVICLQFHVSLKLYFAVQATTLPLHFNDFLPKFDAIFKVSSHMLNAKVNISSLKAKLFFSREQIEVIISH